MMHVMELFPKENSLLLLMKKATQLCYCYGQTKPNLLFSEKNMAEDIFILKNTINYFEIWVITIIKYCTPSLLRNSKKYLITTKITY